MTKNAKLKGWRIRGLKELPFFEWPFCREHFRSYGGNEEGCGECPECGRFFSARNLGRVSPERPVTECASCGAEVPFTPENRAFGGDFYLRHECRNIVGVEYKEGVLNTPKVLEPDWNERAGQRAEKIGREEGRT
ncbi:hypothetical protein AKJ64_02655 [candidate division MSBL1 archaeon SCGC-AAA259E17]|uniref:Uncharacterized protein n=1 Tax=candidate division MSBL1 archaeon SCGC-AAA259E17 TaxID=1698263 RepID=A0A133UEL6_9EURY|nr:hypothetical protein AKJ64_02655 [candidate division MSBL1 archaeon SCGC-AAA259E17]